MWGGAGWQKRNDEKVKDATNLYVCVWIFEKSKTCKTSRFFVLKILIKIDTTKILRFHRQRKQKSKVHVCVSFWMIIFIHVCVLEPWTRFNPWFDPRLSCFCENPQSTILQNLKKFTSETRLFFKQKKFDSQQIVSNFLCVQSFLRWNVREKKALQACENFSRYGNDFCTKLNGTS